MKKLTVTQRQEIKLMYGGKCSYCGTLLGNDWHVDHLKPIRRNFGDGCLNPENDCTENLVPACTACNYNKKSLSLGNWRKQLDHYRDVQVIRDCSQIRHLLRFGQVEFKPKDEPIVFYFETLLPTQQDGVFKYLDRVVFTGINANIDIYVVTNVLTNGYIVVKPIIKDGYHFTDSRVWSFAVRINAIRHATNEEIKQGFRNEK